MPRIRCHYDDCVFLEEGYCGAAAIELEPDSGCLTYTRVEDSAVTEDEDWDEEEFDDEYNDEDEDMYDDDDEWDEDDDL